MRNKEIENLIKSKELEGKRIFSTDILYRSFIKDTNKKSILGIKPCGLWYSIGDSWLEWCIGEDFPGIGRYLYEVELNPKANILFLSTKNDVCSFNKEYIKKDKIFNSINWPKVMEDYDGIEVNPYFEELRYSFHNLLWYCSWDIPSGCIWNSNAKNKIILLEEYDSVL